VSEDIPLENIVISVLQELLEGDIDMPAERVSANYILIRLQDGDKLSSKDASELASIFGTTLEYWVRLQEDQTERESGGT